MIRFYLSPSDLKRVHPDRPTVEQVRQEIARGRPGPGLPEPMRAFADDSLTSMLPLYARAKRATIARRD